MSHAESQPDSRIMNLEYLSVSIMFWYHAHFVFTNTVQFDVQSRKQEDSKDACGSWLSI